MFHISDNFGGEVSIFINYMQASKEEMEGLRTTDVRKVEYLEFPTDPRFRGQQVMILCFILMLLPDSLQFTYAFVSIWI